MDIWIKCKKKMMWLLFMKGLGSYYFKAVITFLHFSYFFIDISRTVLGNLVHHDLFLNKFCLGDPNSDQAYYAEIGQSCDLVVHQFQLFSETPYSVFLVNYNLKNWIIERSGVTKVLALNIERHSWIELSHLWHIFLQ